MKHSKKRFRITPKPQRSTSSLDRPGCRAFPILIMVARLLKTALSSCPSASNLWPSTLTLEHY